MCAVKETYMGTGSGSHGVNGPVALPPPAAVTPNKVLLCSDAICQIRVWNR